MFTDKQQIHEALSRTGRRLALADAGEFALLVCGGGARILLRTSGTTTSMESVLGTVAEYAMPALSH